jgi:N-methylhydantoinase B
MATGSSDGDEMLGHGALGGHPTPPCRTYLRRGDDLIRVKPHRMVEVKRGDVLVKHSSGGAGVGPPEERDPEKVRQDVSNELVSLEAARNVYRVVLDPLTLEIDHAETKRLRAETSEHV